MFSSLFSTTGILYRFMAWVGGLAVLTLLWILASVPIVTAPAATLAMTAGVRRMADDATGPTIVQFARDLRATPRASYTVLLPGVLLIAALCVASSMASHQGSLLVGGFSLAAALFVGLFVVHTAPAAVVYRSTGATFRAVMIRGLRAPWASALAVAVVAAWVLLLMFVPPQLIIVAAMLSGSAPALACWLISDRLARR